MMEIIQVADWKKRKKTDTLVLPFWHGKKEAEAAFRGAPGLEKLAALPLRSGDFRGKEAEVVVLYDASLLEKRVLLLGLGKKEEVSAEVLRKAYAHAVRVARKKKSEGVNILLPDEAHKQSLLAQAAAEGVFLANYAFDQFKKEARESEPLLKSAAFIGVTKTSFDLLKKREKVVSAVHFTRDLVNGNADDVNAQTLSQHARDLAKKFSGVKTTILGKKELEREKMGLLLAVNRGAMQEPALIVLEYRGNPSSKEQTAIVGKGITFDTGGLNLKPTGSIETMKADMAGAAAVLGTIQAAAALGLKKNILGVIAAAENAIDAKSYKPGDVFRSYSGKTVEITNTDAEGRLVLADALAYLQKNYKVDRIIDLATLTGGVVVALGEEVTGLFSNNDKLAEQLFKAGEKTYERVWRLPLYTEYKDVLKSPIADMKNSGGRKASSISGAVFLQEFVEEKMAWAHLDIAGTAYLSEHSKHYHPVYGTGVGVRLLIEFLESL